MTGAPFVGCMFGEYVGIHAQVHAFIHPPDPNEDRPQANLDNRNQWTTILGLAVGPRLSLPINERVSLYALGEGGGFKGLGGRLNQWAPGFTFGGGVNYNVTPTFAVGVFARWSRVYMAPHPTSLVGHPTDQGPEDARFATAGLSLMYFYSPQAQ
jgi:opacity protein-like surface antigen